MSANPNSNQSQGPFSVLPRSADFEGDLAAGNAQARQVTLFGMNEVEITAEEFSGKVIGISGWDSIFENSHTRKLETTTLFFNFPSGCDSRGYVELTADRRDEGVLALGVFMALCQLMGTLRRKSARSKNEFRHSSGEAMSLLQISARIGMDVGTVASALKLLNSEGVRWITVLDASADSPVASQSRPSRIPNNSSRAGQKKKNKKKNKNKNKRVEGAAGVIDSPSSNDLKSEDFTEPDTELQPEPEPVEPAGTDQLIADETEVEARLANFDTLQILAGRIAMPAAEILNIVATASPKIEREVFDAWGSARAANNWMTTRKVTIGTMNWFHDLQTFARHWDQNNSRSDRTSSGGARGANGSEVEKDWENETFDD